MLVLSATTKYSPDEIKHAAEVYSSEPNMIEKKFIYKFTYENASEE